MRRDYKWRLRVDWLFSWAERVTNIMAQSAFVIAVSVIGALGVHAQEMASPRPKVGVLALSNADSIDALFDSLREFGWREGETIDIVFPPASPNPAKLQDNMKLLLAAHVDVVVAQTKLAIAIAKQSTSSIPIVMGALNGDPVKEGFAVSIEHPGKNITGSFYNVTSGGGERVGVLKALLPKMRRMGIVVNPVSSPSLALAADIRAAAEARGLAVEMVPVKDGSEVDAAFSVAKEHRVDGVVAVTGAEMFAIRRELIAAQDKFRIPTVTGSIGYAEMGGIAKLGPDVPALWRKMAPAMDELLRGRKLASELPLVTLDRFELDLNIKVAADLGLVAPDALISEATRVFR